jgi:hypothetical protein
MRVILDFTDDQTYAHLLSIPLVTLVAFVASGHPSDSDVRPRRGNAIAWAKGSDGRGKAPLSLSAGAGPTDSSRVFEKSRRAATPIRKDFERRRGKRYIRSEDRSELIKHGIVLCDSEVVLSDDEHSRPRRREDRRRQRAFGGPRFRSARNA